MVLYIIFISKRQVRKVFLPVNRGETVERFGRVEYDGKCNVCVRKFG